MAKICLILLSVVMQVFSRLSLSKGESISCTFDSDICGWHSESSSKFHWRRGSGQTEDRTSGPLNDHTCANYAGGYAFIAGGDAETAKDIAVLESDVFDLKTETSFSFWYIMNGFGTGTLSLTAAYTNSSDVVWKKEGRQSKDWVKHTLKLKPGRIKLQFKATVRLPVGSDIAVDDVELSSESQYKAPNKTHCEVTSTSTTTTTTTLPTTSTADPLNKTHKAFPQTTLGSSNPSSSSSCLKIVGWTELLPGSCDFENDTCGLKITANHSNKAVTWERTNKMDGSADRNDSIPRDHTPKESNVTEGFYLVFRHSWSIWNSKHIASVETPAIYATYACLSFWYNVPNKYSNLKVYVRDYTGRLTTIWSIDNFVPSMRVTNMFGWQKGSVSIFEDPPFTIVFQSYDNLHGTRVGIDDIEIVGMNITTKAPKTVSRHTTTLGTEASTTSAAIPTGQTLSESHLTESTTTAVTSPQTYPVSHVTETTTVAVKVSTNSSGPSEVDTSSTRTTQKMISNSPNPSNITHFTTSAAKENKKTTSIASKKPERTDVVKGDSDKQTEEEKYKKTSTIVGSAVGALLAIVFLVVIVYFIVHSKNKTKRRREEMKNKTINNGHGHLNGGVSNEGFTSRICLTSSVSNEKPTLNGNAGERYDYVTVHALSTVSTFSPEHKHEHNHKNGDVHLNGHASPVIGEEDYTRL